jgi:NAD(P)-dependent dehydrogenase (short-subunit alcohol dehydrogenase family)
MAAHSDFGGKTAFITGAARGFGKAFAEALSARGAAVAIVDVDGAEAEKAAAAIRAGGGSAMAIGCDVTDENAVGGAVRQVVDAHGGVDILINNAGLHSQAFNEPMAKSGVAKLRRLFDVNVMGTIICSLAARPAMAGRAGAAIVNLASSASYGCQTAYGVSKLAVRGLTVSLAGEFGGDGIRVNAIAPGLIFTDTIRAELNDATIKLVMGQQIIAREGMVDDIVETMLYLCSPRSGFMTGETLRVSGGFALSL